MDIAQLLKPSCVFLDMKAATKKDLLRKLAEAAAPALALDPQIVFEALLTRERLGTTGLGNGIAIPHARIAGVETLTGFFIRLETPIDFHALDRQPVDVIFALFAPADAGADHLDALVIASRLLRDEKLLEQARMAKDAKTLHALLTKSAHQFAA
jgi:PTS system nitrogen regulatory IIA component